MGKKAQKAIPSHGASNAYKSIKKGTSTKWDVNGPSGSWDKVMGDTIQSSPLDPTQTKKTVTTSPAINQHKRLAQTGHT